MFAADVASAVDAGALPPMPLDVIQWQHVPEFRRGTFKKLRSTWLPDPTIPDDVDIERVWTCEICTRTFGSPSALHIHATRAHGNRMQRHMLAVTNVCPWCDRTFAGVWGDCTIMLLLPFSVALAPNPRA